MNTNGCIVRKAVLADLDALKILADACKHELGFVLRPALARSIARGEILVAENNAGLIGFVEYHHRQNEQTTLYHIAVEPDHRGQNIGRRLVGALINDAQKYGKGFILLKCPADLPANHFYAALGFIQVGSEPGHRRRLTIWRLSLL